MLSKSSARTFFLVGTAVCAGAFGLLTLDTLKQVPVQTHEANLTPSAKRGKHLWESNNCMGCHTLMGEGAYYAPELTKVMERRGKAFVAAMLRDPESMYPGQRKMVNYHFSDDQIEDLIAFLTWIGEIDLNGFPPKPTLSLMVTSNASTQSPVVHAENRPRVFNQMCVACHSLGGQGGSVGPALDGVGGRRDREYLKKWLENPALVKTGAKMPKLPLSTQDVVELTAYLSQLK